MSSDSVVGDVGDGVAWGVAGNLGTRGPTDERKLLGTWGAASSLQAGWVKESACLVT